MIEFCRGIVDGLVRKIVVVPVVMDAFDSTLRFCGNKFSDLIVERCCGGESDEHDEDDDEGGCVRFSCTWMRRFKCKFRRSRIFSLVADDFIAPVAVMRKLFGCCRFIVSGQLEMWSMWPCHQLPDCHNQYIITQYFSKFSLI